MNHITALVVAVFLVSACGNLSNQQVEQECSQDELLSAHADMDKVQACYGRPDLTITCPTTPNPTCHSPGVERWFYDNGQAPFPCVDFQDGHVSQFLPGPEECALFLP